MGRFRNRHACAGLFAIAVLAVSGCTSSYLSTPNAGAPLKDGLVYYLPMRPIIVQVVVTTDSAAPHAKIETPSIASPDAIPDVTKRFVLTDQDNPIADDHVQVSVNAAGLLQTSTSSVTSGLDTILKNAATTAGDLGALEMSFSPGKRHQVAPPDDNCRSGQTYNAVFWPARTSWTKTGTLCSFAIEVDDDLAAVAHGTESVDSAVAHKADSGLFYRTELPYLVTIKPIVKAGTPQPSASAIAYSPNESPVAFLPIKKILFATNKVTITMKDGELTGSATSASFDQENNGEIVAFSQIPADVISAYFAAISNIVPKQITAGNDRSALAVSEAQRHLCAAAIAANPVTGKPADQQTAVANIKAACVAAALPTAPTQ